jgi:hypothetical protein
MGAHPPAQVIALAVNALRLRITVQVLIRLKYPLIMLESGFRGGFSCQTDDNRIN